MLSVVFEFNCYGLLKFQHLNTEMCMYLIRIILYLHVSSVMGR